MEHTLALPFAERGTRSPGLELIHHRGNHALRTGLDRMIVEGTVSRVVFRAPDGAFAVLRLDVGGRPEPLTVVGPLGDATRGELLRLEGDLERHPQHGEQFRATRAVVELPRTPEGVGRYLEGLHGIGPELARRLVTAFGVQAIEVIETEPWRAAQVKGMGKRRAARAGQEAAEKRQEREVMIFLQGLGVSLAYAARIRKVYGDQAVAKVRENPYRLARDVPGIGFHVADRIARGMGIDPQSPLRVQAGLVHALETFADEGHVYAPAGDLTARAVEMLTLDLVGPMGPAGPGGVDQALDRLVLEGAVVREGEAVYLARLYRAEVEIARALVELQSAVRPPAPSLVEAGPLSAGQRHALAVVGAAGVAVITGGPGTGKTTVVRALCASWEGAGRRVLLAAPTGRAARRLAEATGRPAQTVHRLLEWGRPSGSQGPFGRDTANPLEADLLVVDEASMLDVLLMRSLVRAMPRGGTLALVGDVDQLPSVGPGQVLADVIESGVAGVATLTEVFRQEEGSGIVENAYHILRGELPVGAPRGDGPDGKGDFFVVPADSPERARELVLKLCGERIPRAFGFDPRRQVQVLAPMHRGPAGTEGLNEGLQALLNPEGAALPAGARVLRVGDKVMQVKNDYERDVFNGDVGLIEQVVEGRVDVDFDGRRVRYDNGALADLDLAYAMTVHKSQGSEYPAVVMTILPQHALLLRRNLLYTAVTRGKRLVVLVGSEWAIRRAVETADAIERHSGLRARLARIMSGQC